MTQRTATRLAWGVVTLVSLQGRPVCAQSFVGTWVRQDTPITMTVEVCCGGGRRLTYHVPVGGSDLVMTVESGLDGKDAPLLVGGKPSGQTMAIRQVDDRHATAVLKMDGQVYGTARGTLSADGKTLTVEDDFSSAATGHPVGKYTERWIRR
jgi:hypothetical protein